MNNFTHKKIGIWGFGVVGQSALAYFDKQNCTSIQILDKKPSKLAVTQTPTTSILQSEQTIHSFLTTNDLILASPGIPLHAYQEFAHKFINELDIIYKQATCAIIAITGTVGKTSITHLLENIIKYTHKSTIAAGNIGYPMLSLINNPRDIAVIELSSFQLQPIRSFAPDLAIITNFFPNHLDHHQSIEEYFIAKCQILAHQSNSKQKALIPLELADDVARYIPLRQTCSLFTMTPLSEQIKELSAQHTIYNLDNKIVYRTDNGISHAIFDCTELPPLTFDANWLVIIAACDLFEIDLTTILPASTHLSLPDHRVQKVGSHNGVNFYNDSKSTVWQATLQAVNSLGKKPIKLFVGGLSKGADRSPLFQSLAGKDIEMYIFGKEADAIAQLCKQFNFTYYAHATLDSAWHHCVQNTQTPCEVLFSPGGSSFDLFVDYQARGTYFTQLVTKHCQQS